MTRVLLFVDDVGTLKRAEAALAELPPHSQERVRTWPDLEAAIITASMLGEPTAVLLSAASMVSGGIEMLLAVDELFTSAPGSVVPLVLLEPAHASERVSFERFTCLRSFVEPPLSVASVLAGIRGAGPHLFGETGTAQAGAASAASSPVGSSAERSAVEPLKMDIELKLKSTGRLSSLSPARLVYALGELGWVGRVRLDHDGTQVELALKGGQIGSEGGKVRGAVARAALTWAEGSYELLRGIGKRGDFVAFGPVRELIELAIKKTSMANLSSLMAPYHRRYPSRTNLFDVRRGELEGFDTLVKACTAATGERRWEELASEASGPNLTMAAGFFALTTDLLIFHDEPARPVEIHYRRLGVDVGPKSHPGQRVVKVSTPQDFSSVLSKINERLTALDRDPRAFFDVELGCGRGPIKASYFRLVKEHHPDAYGGNVNSEIKERSEMLFMRIKEEYQRLVREERRAKRAQRGEAEPAEAVDPEEAKPSPAASGVGEPAVGASPAVPVRDKVRTRRRSHRRRRNRVHEGDEPVESSVVAATDDEPVARVDKPKRKRRPLPAIKRPRSASSGRSASTTPRIKVEKKPEEMTPEDHFKRGEQLLGANKFADAHEAFGMACELKEEEHGVYHAHHAWALFLMDNEANADEAIQLLHASSKMEGGGRVASYVFLGKIDKAMGNEDRAFEFFKKALDVAPKNVEAKREVRLYRLRKEKTDRANQTGLFGRLFKK